MPVVASHPLRIWVVDDNPADVALAQLALQKMDIAFEMTVIHDGEEALSRLRNPDGPPPEVLLLDINLPKLGGLEILNSLQKSHFLVTRVAVVSSSTNTADRDAALAAGARQYVFKSTDLWRYLDTIANVVRELAPRAS
ncbi:MAG: response regulator [Acidobacteriota bacterium]